MLGPQRLEPEPGVRIYLVEDRESAVNHVGRSSYIVAVGRGKEHGKTSHIIGLPQSAERDLANQAT